MKLPKCPSLVELLEQMNSPESRLLEMKCCSRERPQPLIEMIERDLPKLPNHLHAGLLISLLNYGERKRFGWLRRAEEAGYIERVFPESKKRPVIFKKTLKGQQLCT